MWSQAIAHQVRCHHTPVDGASAASRQAAEAADNTAVTGGHDGSAGEQQPSRLRRVDGPLDGSVARPSVRLVREWKGLTVADLLRDEILQRLPGQARAVQRHIERGDYAAAERELPGDVARLLPWPGRERARGRLLVALVALAAVLCASVAAMCFGD